MRLVARTVATCGRVLPVRSSMLAVVGGMRFANCAVAPIAALASLGLAFLMDSTIAIVAPTWCAARMACGPLRRGERSAAHIVDDGNFLFHQAFDGRDLSAFGMLAK